MSTRTKISSLLEQGLLREFNDSGGSLKLDERVILIAQPVFSLFTPYYRLQSEEMVKSAGYGVLRALQRLNAEREIVVGERNDFKDEKGKPVLMKRLECPKEEIWELRVFDPKGMRVFGCFLAPNRILFTHGAPKEYCDSEKKYLRQINLAYRTLRKLGIKMQCIYQNQPAQNYLSI